MKSARLLAAAAGALTCISLVAQEAGADLSANDSAKMTYAPGAAGFGDEAASRAWEMSAITCELQGKLDSKTAKIGDRVALKTTEKVQTSDGRVIPSGSLLVGRVTQVQAHDSDRAIAQLAIAFERAELKSGESFPIYALIRSISPRASLSARDPMMGSAMNTATRSSIGGVESGGMPANGQVAGMGQNGTRLGGRADPLNSDGAIANEPGRAGAGIDDRAANSGDAQVEGSASGASSRDDSAVEAAGHGDNGQNMGAHAQAAARFVPRPTGVRGVMLAGSSSASGLFIGADRKDLQFESGTQFHLGIVGQ